MIQYYILGIILIAAGVVINYSINRRRFYRRGPAGLQHFKTYSGAVATTWLERVGKLIAILLILFGVFFLFAGYKGQAIMGQLNEVHKE
jgi:hypothetical protein